MFLVFRRQNVGFLTTQIQAVYTNRLTPPSRFNRLITQQKPLSLFEGVTHSLLVAGINDDFDGKMGVISRKKANFLDVFFAKLIS
jgi:hypothetical protein